MESSQPANIEKIATNKIINQERQRDQGAIELQRMKQNRAM